APAEGSSATTCKGHVARTRDGVHVAAKFDTLALHPGDACFEAGKARVHIDQPSLRLVQASTRVRQRIELLAHVSEADRNGLAHFTDLLADVRLQLGEPPLIIGATLRVDHEPIDQGAQEGDRLHPLEDGREAELRRDVYRAARTFAAVAC